MPLRVCVFLLSISSTRASRRPGGGGRSEAAASAFVALLPPGSGGGLWRRLMSTTKGRSMRSKVEKRMTREIGRTQRELRRAVKLRKKLMTDDKRLIYNLRRAKKKVALLLQKLKKYELPELPAPRHDPELLTAEQLHAYKKVGFKNRNCLLEFVESLEVLFKTCICIGNSMKLCKFVVTTSQMKKLRKWQ